LSPKQRNLLPLIQSFGSDFGLIGGTAVALQLGHRRSIDFDLATLGVLKVDKIRSRIRQEDTVEAVLVDETNEYSIVVDGVKISFLQYPFKFELIENFRDIIKMPDVIALAAMKAYALGRRAKWKDYVDLYFVIDKYSIGEVTERSKSIFGSEFNEKLFREQLAYFEDIDYTEAIDFMEGFSLKDDFIKEKLTGFSLER